MTQPDAARTHEPASAVLPAPRSMRVGDAIRPDHRRTRGYNQPDQRGAGCPNHEVEGLPVMERLYKHVGHKLHYPLFAKFVMLFA